MNLFAVSREAGRGRRLVLRSLDEEGTRREFCSRDRWSWSRAAVSARGYSCWRSRPIWIALCCLLLTAASLRAGQTAALATNLLQGPVEIQLTADAAQVRVDRDLFVTIHVNAPDYLKVTLPDLRDRFRGFRQAESFARDPITANGVTRSEQRWRLVPDLQRTYRLAPFAVRVEDTRLRPATVKWLATRPVVFAPEPPAALVSGEPDVPLRPFWIPPTLQTVLAWLACGLLALLLAGGIFWGVRRLRRHVRELRMTPRERAFAELDRLLRRNLVARHLYKDFYIELTMVVRRYIERAHLIHAPEQTTEEFLAAAASHPHFTPAAVAQLKTFLESADLIKFAGQEATPQQADEAVTSAKSYVAQDARENERESIQNSEVRSQNA